MLEPWLIWGSTPLLTACEDGWIFAGAAVSKFPAGTMLGGLSQVGKWLWCEVRLRASVGPRIVMELPLHISPPLSASAEYPKRYSEVGVDMEKVLKNNFLKRAFYTCASMVRNVIPQTWGRKGVRSTSKWSMAGLLQASDGGESLPLYFGIFHCYTHHFSAKILLYWSWEGNAYRCGCLWGVNIIIIMLSDSLMKHLMSGHQMAALSPAWGLV